jgi:hypothetical protein
MVFFDSICFLRTKKKELPSKTWEKVIFKFEDKIPGLKNKLGQSTSKKLLTIFKFVEKIPAFSARLSALVTFFQDFEGASFF